MADAVYWIDKGKSASGSGCISIYLHLNTPKTASSSSTLTTINGRAKVWAAKVCSWPATVCYRFYQLMRSMTVMEKHGTFISAGRFISDSMRISSLERRGKNGDGRQNRNRRCRHGAGLISLSWRPASVRRSGAPPSGSHVWFPVAHAWYA